MRDDDVLLFEGTTIDDGGNAFELLEYGICAFEFDDDDELFALLDFFCLLLDDDDESVEGANGSIVGGRVDREDECEISESFSGDDGESLEFASCEIGLYGGIGFTLPPFF